MVDELTWKNGSAPPGGKTTARGEWIPRHTRPPGIWPPAAPRTKTIPVHQLVADNPHYGQGEQERQEKSPQHHPPPPPHVNRSQPRHAAHGHPEAPRSAGDRKSGGKNGKAMAEIVPHRSTRIAGTRSKSSLQFRICPDGGAAPQKLPSSFLQSALWASIPGPNQVNRRSGHEEYSTLPGTHGKAGSGKP